MLDPMDNGCPSARRRNIDDETVKMDTECDSVEGLENPEENARQKIHLIHSVLGTHPSPHALRFLGWSKNGFVDDTTRKVWWPRLLGLWDENELTGIEEFDNFDSLVRKDDYEQLLKDVVRSAEHLSIDASAIDVKIFRHELTQLMCWVLHRNPHLNYYQGYHDIAATILKVMGFQRSLQVLERITLIFLDRFMEDTMKEVLQELSYIYALLERIHPRLLNYIKEVVPIPHFAVAEYTTWFAHKYAENSQLLHRIFDFFLTSSPMMPIYLSTVIVVHRHKEIFDTPQDMADIHYVLSTLPNDLPFDELIAHAEILFIEFPPEMIINCVGNDSSRDQGKKSKVRSSKAREKLKFTMPKFRVKSRFKTPSRFSKFLRKKK